MYKNLGFVDLQFCVFLILIYLNSNIVSISNIEPNIICVIYLVSLYKSKGVQGTHIL